jgi:transcriptional regulator with XRE-family HTH domain
VEIRPRNQVLTSTSTAGVRISRYETGIHEPDIKTLKKIANVLDVPFVYMYCERDDLADLLKHLVLLDRNQIKKIHYVAKERLRGFLKVCMLKSNHIYIISHL